MKQELERAIEYLDKMLIDIKNDYKWHKSNSKNTDSKIWKDRVNRFESKIHILTFAINFVQTFLSVSEKMEFLKDNEKYAIQWLNDFAFSRNTAVDQCTKIATRLIAEKDAEIEALKKENAELKEKGDE